LRCEHSTDGTLPLRARRGASSGYRAGV
jgi:hypothetical protein